MTSLIGISIPEFWFAILCVLLFSLYLGWLPSSGFVSPFEDFWGSLKFLILPAAAIGFRQAAYTTRLTRSSMLDEMNKEYVDTARSLGLSERKVIFKYTLRNAMIPTITISGLQLANLLGGTVVLEIDLRLAGHRAGDLRGDPAARLSADPGRACWCWAASSWS